MIGGKPSKAGDLEKGKSAKRSERRRLGYSQKRKTGSAVILIAPQAN